MDPVVRTTSTVSEALDPVLAAVIENRLQAIATQMAETMLLTSRSLIFQVRDFVTGVFTADGIWVATKDYMSGRGHQAHVPCHSVQPNLKC
jgi:N-methylhydantoinase B/oxoprolinase/acetone carboxylase alpha subunit